MVFVNQMAIIIITIEIFKSLCMKRNELGKKSLNEKSTISGQRQAGFF